jgi:hypothetical protein
MDERIDKIARRMCRGMIGSQHAHYLTALELGPDAGSWDIVSTLAAAVRRVLGVK